MVRTLFSGHWIESWFGYYFLLKISHCITKCNMFFMVTKCTVKQHELFAVMVKKCTVKQQELFAVSTNPAYLYQFRRLFLYTCCRQGLCYFIILHLSIKNVTRNCNVVCLWDWKIRDIVPQTMKYCALKSRCICSVIILRGWNGDITLFKAY